MNPSNQPGQNQQLKPTMDTSKGGLSFNPQSVSALTGNPFLSNYAAQLSGGNLQTDNYSYMMSGDIAYQDHMKKLKEKLLEIKDEIDKMDKNPEKFKTHQLPLARVKKIMKSDEDVRMISAEAPVLFAKACELFIIELTHRAWLHTEEGKRRTLRKNDIAQCIASTDIFDFLIDIIPREEYAKTAIMKKSTLIGNMSFPPQLQYGIPSSVSGLSLNQQLMAQVPNPNSAMNKGFNPNMIHPGMMGMPHLSQFANFDKGMQQQKKDESN